MKSTQELHCLDDEDNLKGGWYYDRQNRHKFKEFTDNEGEKSPSTPSLDPGQMGRPGQSTDPGPNGPTGAFEGGPEAATVIC